jgi:hypothetical protein
LKSKKIQQILKEQKQIFESSPDGAIIHKHHYEINEVLDMKVHPDKKISPISTEIKHLNKTFEEMFTAYKEK